MINMQLRKIFEDTVKAPPDDIKYIFLTDTEAYPANLLLDGCLPVYLTASPEENAFTTEEFLSRPLKLFQASALYLKKLAFSAA